MRYFEIAKIAQQIYVILKKRCCE